MLKYTVFEISLYFFHITLLRRSTWAVSSQELLLCVTNFDQDIFPITTILLSSIQGLAIIFSFFYSYSKK